MRRDWVPVLAALAVAALTVAAIAIGAEAWAVLYPRSPLLARASGWPLVGGWLADVQRRHLPPAAPRQPISRQQPAGRPPAPALPQRSPGGPADLPPGVWPEVWLDAGDLLRAEPSDAAAVVVEATAIANVPVLEGRGAWRRVRWHGREGWVRERPRTQPPLGSAAEPVRPVSGRAAAPELLAAAQAVFAAAGAVPATGRRVGPYPLLTDVEEPAVLLLLDRAAAGVETAYQLRYGLAPIGSPAETVVLFRRRASYEDYLRRTGGPRAETGHVAGGVVAFYREGRMLEDVRTTLIHELVHVLGRRAIGPALPPWLDEGMADDLAESRLGEGAQLAPGTLGGTTLRIGDFFEMHGGEASRELLRRELDAGRLLPLARLTALEDTEFHAVRPAGLAYAEASFFVRQLLAGELADGFRSFLRQVADGTPPEPETLGAALGRSWSELDADLAAWIRGGSPSRPGSTPPAPAPSGEPQ